jgi:SHS2 domain-containing protein
MNSYKIVQHDAIIRIHASGSTRAGLLKAAVKGMFAASGPQYVEGAEEKERSFTVHATDQVALLVGALNEALRQSKEHNESYEDVSFALITDKAVEGRLIGRPVTGFEKSIKAALPTDLEMKKNDEAVWNATITLE